jgi:hypothetical protein
VFREEAESRFFWRISRAKLRVFAKNAELNGASLVTMPFLKKSDFEGEY